VASVFHPSPRLSIFSNSTLFTQGPLALPWPPKPHTHEPDSLRGDPQKSPPPASEGPPIQKQKPECFAYAKHSGRRITFYKGTD
jgi:hypothetical protein